MTQKELIDFLKLNKERFKREYQISKIALFGSYARGENGKKSDVDIAIETSLSDYFKLYDFKEELEKRFKTHVDIVRLREKMNPFLKKRIEKEAIYV